MRNCILHIPIPDGADSEHCLASEVRVIYSRQEARIDLCDVLLVADLN